MKKRYENFLKEYNLTPFKISEITGLKLKSIYTITQKSRIEDLRWLKLVLWVGEKKSKNNLKENYINSVNNYVSKFEKKHDVFLDYWVSDDIGGVAQFGYFFINFSDLKMDIDLNVESNLFIEWYDSNLENKKFINYKSYLMAN